MELKKRYFKYTTLNILTLLGESIYILADTFFIANGIGANGLAALNLSIPFFNFMRGLGMMIGLGGGALYSINRAKGNEEAGNEIFSLSLILGVICSIPFLVISLIFLHNLVDFVGADEAIYNMVFSYMRIAFSFAPFFIIKIIVQSFNRNDGKPTLTMIALALGSVFNIVFDYIFIYKFHWGMFGAALATGMSPIVSMTLFIRTYLKGENNFKFIWPKFPWKYWKKILSIGASSLVSEFSVAIVMILFNAIFLALGGNIAVAAYGIVANIALVFLNIFIGLSQGSQPLLSESYGKGDRKSITSIFKLGFVESLMIGLLSYLLCFFKADVLVHIFNRNGNIELANLATVGVKIYFIGMLFAGVNILMSTYFASIDEARPARIISLLRGFIIIVPLLFIMSKLWGMIGAWFVFPVTEAIVFILSIAILFHVNRIKEKDL